MNTIRNYLDNMFLGLPDTEDVRRAKRTPGNDGRQIQRVEKQRENRK